MSGSHRDALRRLRRAFPDAQVESVSVRDREAPPSVIRRARVRRDRDLALLRAALAARVDALGWRAARPAVVAVLGHASGGRHGTWWHKVGTRNGAKLLAALDQLDEGQGRLFPDGTRR